MLTPLLEVMSPPIFSRYVMPGVRGEIGAMVMMRLMEGSIWSSPMITSMGTEAPFSSVKVKHCLLLSRTVKCTTFLVKVSTICGVVLTFSAPLGMLEEASVRG